MGGGLMEGLGGPAAGEARGLAEPTEVSPCEILSGRVKWFDVVKGFGFVMPDDGGGDILIHYNLLARYGRKSLPEGTRVVVEAVQGPRGRQAAALAEIDLSEAAAPEQSTTHRPSNRVDPLAHLDDAGDYEVVHVRWFNRAKGYGFLMRQDGETQVFIHMETIRRGGFDTLLPAETVEVRIYEGPRGALAVAIRPARLS